MAITYTVDVQASLLWVKWSGPIGAEDLFRFSAAVREDPAVLACGRSITDVRESEILFKGDELRVVTERLFSPAKVRGKIWKTAVIVAKPVQLGVARQHELLSAGLKTTGVFFTEQAARDWVMAE